MSAKKVEKKAPEAQSQGPNLYSLEISIIAGQISEKFAEQNPLISRTIEIRGDQTLGDLHHAIFRAFNREEEHMYEFQFGKKPMGRSNTRYVLSDDFEMDESHVAGDVFETTIDSLELKVRQAFYYWFDFGDDWWHKIKVTAIGNAAPNGKYPKVVQQVGKSPPQYPNWD